MPSSKEKTMIYKSVEALFKAYDIKDGLTFSFHHHLRNGDQTMNQILKTCLDLDFKNISLAPSGIFPVHTTLAQMIEEKRVFDLTCNYLNGPAYEPINKALLKGTFTMRSHGGRARAIKDNDLNIDVAFIAVSACDEAGNSTGLEGKNIMGSLGYAIEDSLHANTVIVVSDTLKNTIENPQIKRDDVDGILLLDSIGDSKGIVSGTLQITNDPLGLKIARDTMKLLSETNLIKNGVSFQSGAGGISLAITKMFNEYLKTNHIQASFYTGGITTHHVNALKEGLVQTLYDVQCFDLDAINSLKSSKNHWFMSAHEYANPNNEKRKIKDLDIVILGATEVDLAFNVNVTTDALNRVIGGSGGHSDTSEDARLSVIVSPLLKGRMPLIKDKVTTITTEGKFVDVIVTERGIAINPRRSDLLELLKTSDLNIMSIKTLQKLAHDLSGKPHPIMRSNKVIGRIENRHGEVIDHLYKKE